ncbi:peptidylprolyl isomerase [Sphingomonas sp. ASV193]|uniref:peptidylprolyl isomerase n=1 Tax=Sphingomonas sp. ASV193 TaxID=3144405 RepID=UPI0032E90790
MSTKKMDKGFRPATAKLLGFAAIAAIGAGAWSQTAPNGPPSNSAAGLALPEAPKLFGTPLPSVVKASVLVNGEVITQSDIDQRVALQQMANGQTLSPDQLEQLRQQVLSNLVDESLEIQAAKHEDITIKKESIDRAVQRVADNVKRTPDQLADMLTQAGSSIATLRRQIEGELAWRQLQDAKIESGISVGDDEVKAVIDKLEASKGTEEFHVSEIFLSANSANRDQVRANADKILQALQQGASFPSLARQYSEASTQAVGGDLGWVRPEQLPAPLEAALHEMKDGAVSRPIEVTGGYSILAVQQTRRILVDDPRDAVLNLKQVSIAFPAGTSEKEANQRVEAFAAASRQVGGCGGADKLASDFHGSVVQSDQVQMRDLPPALQQIMLPLQIGQATQPFGDLKDGVRVLLLCGRDQVASKLPTYDEVYAQLNEQRVNTRSRRYLRDLRRDAIIDYR